MKSAKSGLSLTFRVRARSREPRGPFTKHSSAGRSRQFFFAVWSGCDSALVQYRGWPRELMKACARVPPSSTDLGGIPSTSMMLAIWSASSHPTNSGSPLAISNPAKCFLLLSSYRSIESGSNAIHMCPLKTKSSSNRTVFIRSSGSLTFSCSKMLISSWVRQISCLAFCTIYRSSYRVMVLHHPNDFPNDLGTTPPQ